MHRAVVLLAGLAVASAFTAPGPMRSADTTPVFVDACMRESFRMYHICRTDAGPKLKIQFCVAGDPEIAADVYTFAYIHAHVHAHCYFCSLLRRNVSGVTHSCHTFLPFAHHMPCLNGKCKPKIHSLPFGAARVF
jgi:hypothetical protein